MQQPNENNPAKPAWLILLHWKLANRLGRFWAGMSLVKPARLVLRDLQPVNFAQAKFNLNELSRGVVDVFLEDQHPETHESKQISKSISKRGFSQFFLQRVGLSARKESVKTGW